MRNYLQDVNYIKNSPLCMYDGNNAYTTNFTSIDGISGWDIYYSTYMYGAWNGVLFGTSYGRECFIGRSLTFPPIPAEYFFFVKIMMKITVNHETRTPTQGKIRWITLNDYSFNEAKEFYFDLIPDDSWHLYSINVGPAQYWQGDITNLRVYPFVDGSEKDQFAIQYIKIASNNKFNCTNTDCSYYLSYEHPCPGAGVRSSVTAGESKEVYTTVSGVNDTLFVNIDSYGSEVIHLGTNRNVPGRAIARIIGDALSRVSIGGYTYSEVEHTFLNQLKITSGNTGTEYVQGSSFTVYQNPDEGALLIYADSVDRSAAYFSSLGIDLVEISDGVYGLGGSIYAIMDLFVIRDYFTNTDYPREISYDIVPLKDKLEVAGHFSGVTEVKSARRMVLSQVESQTNNYVVVDTTTLTITSPDLRYLYVTGSAREHAYAGGYSNPHYAYDVYNGAYLFCTSSCVWWPPTADYHWEPEDGDHNPIPAEARVWSNNIQFVTRYGGGKMIVYTYDDSLDASFAFSNTTAVIPQTGFELPYVLVGDNEVFAQTTQEELLLLSAAGIVDSGLYSPPQSIEIVGGTAAEELGFFNSDGENISEVEDGSPPATGFDYASSRRLKAFEVNRLATNDFEKVAYYHNPVQYNVEGGRRDLINSTTSNTRAKSFTEYDVYKPHPNRGQVLIDVSHPINDSGRLKHITINAEVPEEGAKIHIVRPRKDGSFDLIYTLDFPFEDDLYKYTSRQVTYRIDCDLLVSKGDCIAVWNADVTVATSFTTGDPNATYYQFSGELTSGGNFNPGSLYNTGVAGFQMYARSDRLQSNLMLDIDLGQRTNIDTLSIYGEETKDYFEYNVASCLDITWDVNLYSEKHTHIISNYYMIYPRIEHHTNIAYGIECLNDGILSSDNGQMGTGYGTDGDGLYTTGKPAYFYVNGDAEWAHNGASFWNQKVDPKYEYHWGTGNPNGDTSVRTVDYETDPISFLLTYPNKTEISMHKAKIYFKEPKNFNSFSMSYYLGDSSVDRGNDLMSNFYRIPKYNTIALDGVVYYEAILEQDGVSRMLDGVLDLMFRNPTTVIQPIIVDGEITNWAEVQAQYKLEWNTLEHTFDDVYGQGFNITTYNHSSTKIYEIEVYSKIPIDPTLVDNASTLYSDYGDFYAEAPFYAEGANKISAYLGTAPRYISIELTSQSEFLLRGIALEVSDDDVLLDSCKDTVLLDHSKTNTVNDVNEVIIENIYDMPFDLLVDLPRNIESSKQLTFWSRLGSINDIIYPEVGPGGILHKNPDFLITNQSTLCSINCPTYGLNNLVDNAPIYIQHDGYTWTSFKGGILHHGESLDYSNDDCIREIRLSFPSISRRYWKIVATGGSTYIGTVNVFYGSVLKTLLACYYNSPLSGPQTLEAYPDTGVALSTPTLINDDTSAVVNLFWQPINDENSEYYGVDAATNTIINGGIVAVNRPGNTVSERFAFNSNFDNLSVFTLNLDFWMRPDAVGAITINDFHFKDSNGDDIIRLTLYDEATGTNTFSADLYDKDTEIVSGESWNYINTTTVNELNISRYNTSSGIKLSIDLNSNSCYDGFISSDNISEILVSFYQTPIGNYYETALVNSPLLDDTTAFGFRLDTTDDDSIDTISLKTYCNQQSLDKPDSYEIYVSHDNVTYTKHADAVIENDWASYSKQIAIDLGRTRVLDIIRNYGDMQNKLRISAADRMLFSSTDTDDINSVVWLSPEPSALISPSQAGVIEDSMDGRTIIPYGGMTTTDADSMYNGHSLYFDGSNNYFKLEVPSTYDDSLYKFGAQDFTIHWWEYRKSYSYPGGNEVGDTVATLGLVNEDSQSDWHAGILLGRTYGTTYRHEFLTAGAVGNPDRFLNLQIGNHILNEWVHYAVVKKNNTYYSFRNGLLTDYGVSTKIPNACYRTTILDYYSWYLGRLSRRANYSGRTYTVYFDGYIDEFTLINGFALWDRQFVPPAAPYETSEDFVYTDARWINMTMVHGDPTLPKTLDKLGLYPNIEFPYSPTGPGYNCDWTSLGNKLTDYSTKSVNVAEGITNISGSSTVVIDMGPDTELVTWGAYKAVNGDFTDGYSNCWGFLGSDPLPTLELDLGATYNINQVTIYHGDSYASGFMNNDYELFYSNSDENLGDTILLLHFDNAGGFYIDSAEPSRTLGVYGQPTVSSGIATLSGSTSGVYLDGENDYLTLPWNDGAWNFGTEDFTIDFWITTTDSSLSAGNDRKVIAFGANSATAIQIMMDNSPNTGALGLYVANGWRIAGTTAIDDGIPHYVVLQRHAGITTLFIDGVSDGTYVDTNDYVVTVPPTIGRRLDTEAGYWHGTIAELRVSDIARYAGSFVPDSNITPDANTVFLLQSDTYDRDTGFTDSSSYGWAVTPTGTIYHSAAQAKAGATSIRFDGTNGHFRLPDGLRDIIAPVGQSNANSMDCWVYLKASELDVGMTLINMTQEYSSAYEGKRYWWWIDGVGRLCFWRWFSTHSSSGDPENVSLNSTSTIPLDEWAHVAITYDQTTIRLFINGVLEAEHIDAVYGSPYRKYPTDRLFLGSDIWIVPQDRTTYYTPVAYNRYHTHCYIDNFRISNIARWTQAFTPPAFVPPSVPHVVDDNTVSLLHFDGTTASGNYLDSSIYNNKLETNGSIYQVGSPLSKAAFFSEDPGYLSTPSSGIALPRAEDFTIDFKWYPVIRGSHGFIGQYVSTTNFWFFMYELYSRPGYNQDSQWFYKITLYAIEGGVTKSHTTWDFQNLRTATNLHRWYHVALVVKNSVAACYIDGVALTPAVSTAHSYIPEFTADVTIGSVYDVWNRDEVYTGLPVGQRRVKGALDEFRISKGCRWQDDFSPPTVAYSGDEDSYKLLVAVEDNENHTTLHSFDTVSARRIRMRITDYTAPTDAFFYSPYLDEGIQIDGGFIKEIQVFTEAGGGEVTSEDWPVVCIDLIDSFNITNHKLFNNHWYISRSLWDPPVMIHTWDNSEGFYKYSDSNYDTPKQVAFSRISGAGSLVVFTTSEEYTTLEGNNTGYVFGVAYLSIGYYDVSWQTINVKYPDTLILKLINNNTEIDISPEYYGTGTIDNNATINIITPGYYTIKSEIITDEHDEIGAGTIAIQRVLNNGVRWVSLVRDTATDHAWTNQAADKGLDYLDKIKIYGDRKYIPTEYYNWWTSTLSTLSNDGFYVKVNKRSLRLDYPESSEHDELQIIDADSFGTDTKWSELDLLSFWLYISDIDAFDVDWGGIAFGTLVDRDDIPYGYYQWDFNNMSLQTGWNRIRLRFDSYDFTNPIPSANDYLNGVLNFRNRPVSSFHMVYRGKGTAFHMNIDDLRIERNYFEDDVKFGKGLCLTWGECLDVPVADMSPNHGSLEFWAKLYYDVEGMDVFKETASRNFFSIVNNNNEMISMGIRSGSWFEVGVGGAVGDFSSIVMGSTKIIPSKYALSYKDIVHIGLVWSHDGSRLPANETLRLYINGDLLISSQHQWKVEDSKAVSLRLGGASSVLAYNNDADGSAIFDNLKVYNYCKDGFDINKEDSSFNNYITPNHFIELSQDGTTFYNIDDGVLPFTFEKVPAGESRTVYIRSNKDDRFKDISKTGTIEVNWITTV